MICAKNADQNPCYQKGSVDSELGKITGRISITFNKKTAAAILVKTELQQEKVAQLREDAQLREHLREKAKTVANAAKRAVGTTFDLQPWYQAYFDHIFKLDGKVNLKLVETELQSTIVMNTKAKNLDAKLKVAEKLILWLDTLTDAEKKLIAFFAIKHVHNDYWEPFKDWLKKDEKLKYLVK